MKSLSEMTQEEKLGHYIDTVHAIAVRGLGLTDPWADDSPTDVPADWCKFDLLSEKVAAVRIRGEKMLEALTKLSDCADSVTRQTDTTEECLICCRHTLLECLDFIAFEEKHWDDCPVLVARQFATGKL